MQLDKTTEGFIFSNDKSMLNVSYIHHYLSTKSYWAKNIPIEIVRNSIDGSICFGIYTRGNQIGFARLITDNATFAYLADVFIDENYRGHGLSKELMTLIMKHIHSKNIRRVMLATKDAHGLYEQFGFEAIPDPQKIMGIKFFEEY